MNVDIKHQIMSFVKALKGHMTSILVVSCSVALGVVAAILGLVSSGSNSDLNSSWQLPARATLNIQPDIDTMLAAPLFGGEPLSIAPLVEEAVETSLDGDRWQLLGIVSRGKKWNAVTLNLVTGKLNLYETGDTLPGGEVLTMIAENEIKFEKQSQSMRIALFSDAESLELD
ncbi:MAG: hypothetical protein RIC29_01855 [Rhodospirillaceae bacterium]